MPQPQGLVYLNLRSYFLSNYYLAKVVELLDLVGLALETELLWQ